MALDLKTHRVFLMTAKWETHRPVKATPDNPHGYPMVVPGTAKLLIFGRSEYRYCFCILRFGKVPCLQRLIVAGPNTVSPRDPQHALESACTSRLLRRGCEHLCEERLCLWIGVVWDEPE